MDYSLEISCEDQANASLDTMPSRHQLSTVLKYVKIGGFNLERVPVFISSGRRGWVRKRKKKPSAATPVRKTTHASFVHLPWVTMNMNFNLKL